MVDREKTAILPLLASDCGSMHACIVDETGLERSPNCPGKSGKVRGGAAVVKIENINVPDVQELLQIWTKLSHADRHKALALMKVFSVPWDRLFALSHSLWNRPINSAASISGARPLKSPAPLKVASARGESWSDSNGRLAGWACRRGFRLIENRSTWLGWVRWLVLRTPWCRATVVTAKDDEKTV